MNNDDPKLHNYQDDFDTKFNDVDPVMAELGDDPTKELGISPREFRDELNKQDVDNNDNDNDDMREAIEDADEDGR
jgi:hypothetical protein